VVLRHARHPPDHETQRVAGRDPTAQQLHERLLDDRMHDRRLSHLLRAAGRDLGVVVVPQPSGNGLS
jgi:hypothetical protein